MVKYSISVLRQEKVLSVSLSSFGRNLYLEKCFFNMHVKFASSFAKFTDLYLLFSSEASYCDYS